MRSFAAFPALMALVPTVLGATSFLRRRDSSALNVQEVNVQLQFIPGTSEIEIAVLDKTTSDVLGQACSNTLNNFHGLTISANIDQYGSGPLTVDSKTYHIHENPDYSGGITCSRIYNHLEVFVTCSISIPASIPLTPLSGNNPSCFTGNAPTAHQIAKTIATENAAPLMTMTLKNNTKAARSLNERQQCTEWNFFTELVGDGNPHQNYYYQQVTDDISCDSVMQCDVAQSQSITCSVGWSAEVNPAEWITGRFDVSVDFLSETQYGCTGQTGDTICLWHETIFTAYTVQDYEKGICDAEASKDGNPYVMFSPNTHNDGKFYCVVGTCRNKNDGYWYTNGPAGGPQ